MPYFVQKFVHRKISKIRDIKAILLWSKFHLDERRECSVISGLTRYYEYVTRVWQQTDSCIYRFFAGSHLNHEPVDRESLFLWLAGLGELQQNTTGTPG